MSGMPAYVANEVERHLNAIAALWRPHVKLTLLIRSEVHSEEPGDRDAVFTTDNLADAIVAIQRRMGAGPEIDEAAA